MLCSQSRVDEEFSTDDIYLLKEYGRRSEISCSCTSYEAETPTQTHRIDSCNWSVIVSFHTLQKQPLTQPHSVTLRARSKFSRRTRDVYEKSHGYINPALSSFTIFPCSQSLRNTFYHRRTFFSAHEICFI